MEFIKVSWEKLYTNCVLLAQKTKAIHVDEIVAISRGGVVIGRLLSDFLSLPMSHITIASYSGITQEKEPEITQGLVKDISKKTILLTDDVADSGKTFLKTVPYLEEIGVKKIYTVTPFIKPHTQFIPDFWVEKISSWIIFPYEIHEAQQDLERILGSRNAAIEKLQELGAEKWEILE